MTGPEVIIITGISGSGKSSALKVLEDTGFFCVDNVPVIIIPTIVDLLTGEELSKQKIAFGIDIRGREFFSQFPEMIEYLETQGIRTKVLFLDCKDRVLIRRFSETRRKHPLSETENPLSGIEKERELLSTISSHVDLYIDTTDMNVHQLRDFITKEMPSDDMGRMKLTILSFGFKHGVPAEADLLFDARFLPNPYFETDLKEKNGLDQEVKAYVFKHEISSVFVSKVKSLMEYLIPHYIREGKFYLTLAIGCTGGHHRSVAIAENLASSLQVGRKDVTISVKHRDLGRI